MKSTVAWQTMPTCVNIHVICVWIWTYFTKINFSSANTNLNIYVFFALLYARDYLYHITNEQSYTRTHCGNDFNGLFSVVYKRTYALFSRRFEWTFVCEIKGTLNTIRLKYYKSWCFVQNLFWSQIYVQNTDIWWNFSSVGL